MWKNHRSSPVVGKTKDWIIWLPNSNSVWSPENIKEIKRYGLESRIAMEKDVGTINFKVSFQHNFLNAVTQTSYIENDASIGNQLMYTPKNQGQFCLDVSFRNFMIYYRQSLMGRVYINSDNSSYLPNYSPADFGLEWTSSFIEGKQIISGIKVMNIFNEDYHVISYRPMPGIHVLFNLKINLKQQ